MRSLEDFACRPSGARLNRRAACTRSAGRLPRSCIWVHWSACSGEARERTNDLASACTSSSRTRARVPGTHGLHRGERAVSRNVGGEYAKGPHLPGCAHGSCAYESPHPGRQDVDEPARACRPVTKSQDPDPRDSRGRGQGRCVARGLVACRSVDRHVGPRNVDASGGVRRTADVRVRAVAQRDIADPLRYGV
jgi:hypothetical protein